MTPMSYEGDAFISYAHIDNRVLSDDQSGWVADFQRALETRVAQLIGREASVWWDPELRGNDVFSDVLMERLTKVAALVSIVSPAYVNSTWGRRELTEFVRAAQTGPGLRVGDKARIFKILKTLVPRDQQPPELEPLLGYEFYTVASDTQRVHELSPLFGPEAEFEFVQKLEEVAQDLKTLLESMHTTQAAAFHAQPKGSIYVAETTNDLKPRREALRRTLQQLNYTVLPSRTMPLAADEVKAVVEEDLSACRMSIHLLGGTYGLVPEGTELSIPELQHELAAARPDSKAFTRILWIAPGTAAIDDRQRRLLDRLRLDEGMRPDTDILEKPFEDLLTVVTTRLTEIERSRAACGVASAGSRVSCLYLVHDRRDEAAVAPFSEFLFQSCEVLQPLFEGDEREVREAHEDALRTCDGVLLFYGQGNEAWLRRKLTEVQKSPGTGRAKALPKVGVCLAPPRTPAKERFRTHYATVVPQWNGVDASALQAFLDVLHEKGHESPA